MFLVSILKAGCKFIYFILKAFLSPKNRVTLITRRQNYTSIDFQILEDRIHELHPKHDVVILNHKQRSPKDHALAVLVEMFYLATSKAVIVDSYIIPVSILKHRPGLVIVQIWHALGAVKKFGHQALDTPEGSTSKIAKLMDMHRGYDFVTAGSQATQAIFSE
ncbi:MAG: CDP-glycerol glycerophosphotransferase family protein, partial [Candidatus Ancillula sp.]|nr:CDP-glycerol glycerophosphotransferase family protein [Candidatus Ancillula sp.]